MFYDRYIELCQKREKKPYTVAKELGLTNSNVAQWKKGSTPRLDVLQKIADYFGVKVSYFFETGEEQKESPPHGGEPPTIKDWEKALEGKSKEELKEIIDIAMKKFMEQQ